MSPEQLRGETTAIDGRTDVYAIGVLLFRLLAGRQPFDLTGLALIQAVQHILQRGTSSLKDAAPDLPDALHAITARAMAHRREDRFESAAAMAAELRAYLEGRETARYDLEAGSDRTLLAIGLTSGRLSLIDVRSGQVEPLTNPGGNRVSSVTFDETRAVVVWTDGRAQTIGLPEKPD
jgi:hypothetical protein